MKYEIKIKDLIGIKASIFVDLLQRDKLRLRARIAEAAKKEIEEYMTGMSITIQEQREFEASEVVLSVELPD